MWNTVGLMGNARAGDGRSARTCWGTHRESKGQGTGLLSLRVQAGLSPQWGSMLPGTLYPGSIHHCISYDTCLGKRCLTSYSHPPEGKPGACGEGRGSYSRNMAESWAKKWRREEKRGWGNFLEQVKASLGSLSGSGSRPGQQGGSRLDGERLFLCSVCLSQYYKFRSCLDPETVWRPEGTAAASRREVKEGQDGSSMVSQAQKRALAGQTKPNLVPYYVLTLNARRGCLGRAKSLGKGVGSEGCMGQPEGSRLHREVLAMPVLEPLSTLGGAEKQEDPWALQTTSLLGLLLPVPS